VTERNKGILERIREIKAEHPLWGFRRVWAYLRFQKQIIISRKRIYRLMKENRLLVPEIKRLKAVRKNYPRKIRAQRVNEVWGIDMTKVMTKKGWVYLVVVLDWFTKKIVGLNADTICRSKQWQKALSMAVNGQFSEGIRSYQVLSLVSDNGSQPTSVSFIRECGVLGVKQIFASYDNPKGNADTERLLRTLKEDLVWPREFEDLYEFEDALVKWVNNYNTDYPHSSLGYMTPQAFEEKTKAVMTPLPEVKPEAFSSHLFSS